MSDSPLQAALQPLPARVSAALAVVRVIVGVLFAAHGAQKLLGFGLAGVSAFFGQAGIPLPALTAPLVTFVELLGGLALALGLFTRLAALGLFMDMLGALFFVHLREGLFLPKGYEYVLVLLAVLFALGWAGPGAYSVDAGLQRRGR